MRIAQLVALFACVAATNGCVIESTSGGAHPPPPPPPPPTAPQPATATTGATPTGTATTTTPSVDLPASSGTSSAAANDAGWTDLAAATVTTAAQAGVLTVSSDRAVRRVRFGAEGSSVELLNIIFVFADGQRHAVDARHFMRAGGRSQDIDLPGGARVIRVVEFSYQGLDASVGQATVRLFGKAARTIRPGATLTR